jgi:16S rRNA (uracil1498-N3)-methyltransferase
MTLHRFFVPPDLMVGDRFALPESIARQVQAVLRLRDGERIVLLPGDGTEAVCRLEGGQCVVEERRPSAGEPKHRLTIVQALLKGDGLETVVRSATEVGVAEFQLVVTERCVVRDLPPRRVDRLRSVAREAAEQSERGVVPAVAEPTSLSRALAGHLGATLLFERHEADRLSAVPAPPALVIGPEGGFTEAELEDARAAGVRVAGLGARILRSRTVAAAAAAVVLSQTGDFA